jgi:hypothetical protein
VAAVNRPVNVNVLREHPDVYAQAACSLPDCGQPLYIERSEGGAVYLSDSAFDLSVRDHTSTWQVKCGGGHTVLVPLDTGQDSFTFGECAIHEKNEAHDDSCDDLARLRLVTAAEPTP